LSVLIILLIISLFYFTPKQYKVVVALGLLAHIFLLIYNIYFNHIKLMWTSDAFNFYQNAIHYNLHGALIGNFNMGAIVYVYFIAFLFKHTYLTSNLMLIGQLSNITFWLFSMLMFIKICQKLLIDRSATINLALLLLLINPYTLIATTSLLRESSQVALTSVTLYMLILFIQSQKARYIILGFFFSVFAGLTHYGLLACLLLTCAFTALLCLYQKNVKTPLPLKLKFCLWVLALVFAYDIFIYIKFLHPILFHKIQFFAAYSGAANTSYPAVITHGHFYDFVLSWFNYMFYPFPWHIHNITDLYASSFGILRLILLSFAIGAYYLEKESIIKKSMLVLLICFFITTLAYSAGTSNYGTSMRHQILTFWIIAILGVRGFFMLLLTQLPKPLKIFRRSP
jgi:hypothetical protein